MKEKNGRSRVKPVKHQRSAAARTFPGPQLAASPGFHLQRILVPVDFSQCSAKALEYALAFARPAQAQIILFHVVPALDYPMYGQEFTTNYTELQTNVINMGRERLAEFSEQGAKETDSLKLLVSEGSAWSEIVDAARREKADLIIIPTHGNTGLKHVFLGSTAERVVRHAGCPVLVVREKEREFI